MIIWNVDKTHFLGYLVYCSSIFFLKILIIDYCSLNFVLLYDMYKYKCDVLKLPQCLFAQLTDVYVSVVYWMVKLYYYGFLVNEGIGLTLVIQTFYPSTNVWYR